LGKVLIKDQQVITELAIYKKKSDGKFALEKLRDFSADGACIQFCFSNTNSEELLFFTKEDLFKFNYLDESKDRETMYILQN
jgi:hypothetical protein